MAPHAAVPTKPISGLHALKLVALAFLTDNNMTSVASDHSLTATLLSLVHMHPATPPPLPSDKAGFNFAKLLKLTQSMLNHFQ